MAMEVSGRRQDYGNGYEDKVRKQREEDKPEETTVSTDRVDQEVKKLKEEKSRIEQQIRMAGEGREASRLRSRLSQIEQELGQKDNDAYRRGHVDVIA